MRDTAKLFVTGRSQAVRLPREYRFEARMYPVGYNSFFLTIL